jgi:uncharacterized protein YaaQ
VAAASDGDRLIDALMRRGLQATKIASRGGFLRRGSVTILSGVEDDDVDIVLELTQRECRARTEVVPAAGLPIFGEAAISPPTQPIEVRVGGAAAFVLPIERFERF